MGEDPAQGLRRVGEATVARWRDIVTESELAFREIYDRLGVLLEPEDSAGESFYNSWLPDIVQELTATGIAPTASPCASLPPAPCGKA